MTAYNPKLHHRQSIRLKGYDYAKEGLYFITICCQNRAHLFGEIINGAMIKNPFGEIAHNEWLKTEAIRDNCLIHESIIMPNHLHGIIEISHQKKENNGIGKFQSPSQSLGAIIRGFKIATIKNIKDFINNNSGESILIENSKNIRSAGELQFAPEENSKNIRSASELRFAPEENSKNIRSSTGELQFAPTTGNSAATEIIKSLDFKIWQRNYYEHIIRNQKAYDNISNYIINNPIKWEEDKFHKKNNK